LSFRRRQKSEDTIPQKQSIPKSLHSKNQNQQISARKWRNDKIGGHFAVIVISPLLSFRRRQKSEDTIHQKHYIPKTKINRFLPEKGEMTKKGGHFAIIVISSLLSFRRRQKSEDTIPQKQSNTKNNPFQKKNINRFLPEKGEMTKKGGISQ
jgi:hypothetical protein